MLRKTKNFMPKDVFDAYLIEGARYTFDDEFPIIEQNMVTNIVPNEIIQWNRKRDVIDKSKTCICFYCDDASFISVIRHPKNYVNKLKEYQCVIGPDLSPYDNMPLTMQKFNIFKNIAITFFFAKQGIRIIPNVRLGDDRTLSSLDAYPKNTLIAVGTHGFTKELSNRYIYEDQLIKIIDYLKPTGICVYGPAKLDAFNYAQSKGIKIYQFDSYTMKQNKLDKVRKDIKYER